MQRLAATEIALDAVTLDVRLRVRRRPIEILLVTIVTGARREGDLRRGA